MKRRDFLRYSLASLISSQLTYQTSNYSLAQDAEGTALELNGAIWNVHDPVIIKQDETYYLFSTGADIPVRQSPNLQDWLFADYMTVFEAMPQDAGIYVPGADSIWAPDISYYNDRYHLYYSISTFGSSHSAIGLATNTTLHSNDEDFEWIDQGIVVTSDRSDNYNAIDANLILDEDGEPWLAFGSHWSGIKMIRLDYATGKQSTDDEDPLFACLTRYPSPRSRSPLHHLSERLLLSVRVV